MEAASKTAITVEALINAPIEKVWTYWSDPEHIVNWCSASEEWHAPYADNDLREGGSFKTTMAARDGSVSFDFEGVYDKVLPNQSIEYSMSDGRTVKISFEDKGNETLVTETFDAETLNSDEAQKSGWQAILDNFKKYTESR